MYPILILLSELLIIPNSPNLVLPVNNHEIAHYSNYSLSQANISKGKTKGNLQDMLDALGERETGNKTGDPSQYTFENPQLGFLGKYQFAEVLLIRLGYYQASRYYGNGADKNYWRGTWTNKQGINSKAKLLNSPQVQEAAIREAFSVYWQDINYSLKKQGKSINDYLGKSVKFSDGGKTKSITVTHSGLLAAAHLRGYENVVNLLVKGNISRDEFGTSILEYLEKFGGYSVQ
jgi:hypothetical protein